MLRYRHVILDRDGVLNREPLSETPVTLDLWDWEDGSLEALRLLADAGVRLSIATNQSWVGRGVIGAAEVEAVHQRLIAEAEAAGVHIASVQVCPHAPTDGCDCRKPAPGLLVKAMQGSEVAPEATLFVGDALRDLQAGRAAGVDVALVRTGKGRLTEQAAEAAGAWVFDRLIDVALHLVAGRPFEASRVGGHR
jgi:D-glycero-D-manno-heptose 1,7-bisphosphate phosphatase